MYSQINYKKAISYSRNELKLTYGKGREGGREDEGEREGKEHYIPTRKSWIRHC